MSGQTEVQIIKGIDGKPAFVVVPYSDWVARRDREQSLVPNEVVTLVFDRNRTPIRAWREHFGLTQAEVAAKCGISQSAYAQMEAAENPRPATRKKIAAALGITTEQLDF